MQKFLAFYYALIDHAYDGWESRKHQVAWTPFRGNPNGTKRKE